MPTGRKSTCSVEVANLPASYSRRQLQSKPSRMPFSRATIATVTSAASDCSTTRRLNSLLSLRAGLRTVDFGSFMLAAPGLENSYGVGSSQRSQGGADRRITLTNLIRLSSRSTHWKRSSNPKPVPLVERRVAVVLLISPSRLTPVSLLCAAGLRDRRFRMRSL